MKHGDEVVTVTETVLDKSTCTRRHYGTMMDWVVMRTDEDRWMDTQEVAIQCWWMESECAVGQM